MIEIDDPLTYLENKDSKETVEFYTRHNESTDRYLDDTTIGHFTEELLCISDVDLKGLDSIYGKFTFWVERRKDWQKVKLFCRKKTDGPTVLLDLEDSDESLDFWYPSPDGRKLLYGTSKFGNEQTTIKIKNVITGAQYDDQIEFAGFTDQGNICWLDNSTFIYPRMNGFNKIGPQDKWLLGTKLYKHRLGTDPKDDELIFGKDCPDTVMLTPTLSSDSSGLYVTVCEDELTHTVWLVDLATLRASKIGNEQKAAFSVKAGKGKVYALTNYKAPRYRLLMYEEDDLESNFDDWDEVLPESEDVLQDFWIHKSGSIVAKYSHNVASRLNIYDSYGNQTEIVRLPELSIVQSVVCLPEQQFIYISASGYTIPTTHYLLRDTNADIEQTWTRERLASDGEIRVSQKWAASKDGTKIPYYFIRKESSSNESPTIIFGYGGFNIAFEPSYLTTLRPWVLAGGSVAIANLRGGSEFGEEWHRLGSMEYKQNTFDDCIAVAEHLIEHGDTNAGQLGVMGGSNGGLMVAAVTLQRPDLFRAGAALVPLTDMLEFYKHQVAEFWVHEYGDPRIPKERSWIEKWSPYHYPIDPTAGYPALYYETALHDARVSPLHAFKMVSRLEATVEKWKGPLLLRTMTDTGHQSSNLTKADLAKRTAEYYAFFARELGLVISAS